MSEKRYPCVACNTVVPENVGPFEGHAENCSLAQAYKAGYKEDYHDLISGRWLQIWIHGVKKDKSEKKDGVKPSSNSRMRS